MADTFGLSFDPSGLDQTKNRGDQAAGAAPVQDAIRTLNLRVPQFRGAAPINPTLLNGPGAQGVPPMGGGPVGPMGGAPNLGLEAFLRRLFGQLALPGGMGGSPSMGAAPAPNFVPGIDVGEPAPGGTSPGGVDFGKTPAPAPAPSQDFGVSGTSSKFENDLPRMPEAFGSY